MGVDREQSAYELELPLYDARKLAAHGIPSMRVILKQGHS